MREAEQATLRHLEAMEPGDPPLRAGHRAGGLDAEADPAPVATRGARDRHRGSAARGEIDDDQVDPPTEATTSPCSATPSSRVADATDATLNRSRGQGVVHVSTSLRSPTLRRRTHVMLVLTAATALLLAGCGAATTPATTTPAPAATSS